MRQCSAQLSDLARARRQRTVHRLRRRRPRRGRRGRLPLQFRNSGQTCITANRFLVQDGVHMSSSSVHERGNPTDPGRRLQARRRCRAADRRTRAGEGRATRRRRVERGAELVLGGKRLEGQFFEPSVLTGVPADAAMGCEETFGPVAGIARFAEEGEAMPGERHALRARGVLLLRVECAGVARFGGARVRHRRDQHGLHLDRGRAVRRDEGSGIGRKARSTGSTIGSS